MAHHDYRMPPADRERTQGGGGPRYVISIDYGTTYTGAAWAVVTGEEPRFQDVEVVQDWPDGNDPKVPSLITYDENASKSWGFGITDSQDLIQRTKLKLPRRGRAETLEDLRGYLNEAQHQERGSRAPLHLLKTVPETLLEYLFKVALCVREDIEKRRDPVVLRRAAIDLVISHPGKWDARAKNSSFRAAAEAFRMAMPEFPNRSWTYRMVTEPEACAMYTLRESEQEIDSLRVGECFVVVDAGGGTVDLASYEIEQVAPRFRMHRSTEVSSAQCGATCVDDYFLKEFLPERLGEEEYQRLVRWGGRTTNASGVALDVLGRGTQMVMANFQLLKQDFAGPRPGSPEAPTNTIELPDDIGQGADPRGYFEGGQLFITDDDMKTIFSSSIQGTLDLIEQQLSQNHHNGLVVKTIFLSGGFSRSEYLFNEVDKLARLRGFRLLRGQDSWTAVAKGAALMGLGIGCDIPPACIPCPTHIGVVISQPFAIWDHDHQQGYQHYFDKTNCAKDIIKWVIAKGDLIERDEPTRKSVNLTVEMSKLGYRPASVSIVRSRVDAPRRPTQLLAQNISDVLSLDFDFSRVPPRLWKVMHRQGRDGDYYLLDMKLVVQASQQDLQLTLWCASGLNDAVCVRTVPLAA